MVLLTTPRIRDFQRVHKEYHPQHAYHETSTVRRVRNNEGDIAIFTKKLDLPISPRPKTDKYDALRGWLMPLKKMSSPVSPAATPREQAIIEQWKADRKRIREGPLFVRRVIDSNARVGKAGATANAGFNAFNGLQTYSARYERKYRQRPDHDGKLWCKLFSHMA